MQSFKFYSMDGISVDHITKIFKSLLTEENFRVRHFDEDNYEWCVGINVARRINELVGRKPLSIETGPNSILGIDVKQSYSVEPNKIVLQLKRDVSKKLINSVYGKQSFYMDMASLYPSDMFITMPRQSGRTTSLKKLEETMNKIKFNRVNDISIKNVIFNDPATIIFWNDGTKTVVKAENEEFDPEKGLAMAISKKVLGNKGNYYETFKKWLPEEDKNDKKIEEEYDITEILTAKQLAEKIGSSVSTVLRDCRRGLHPGAVKVDNKWLIPFENLKKEDSNE